MHCADKPAESYIVVQRLQAAPRLPSRGNVDERQENSGDELQQEDRQRRAAEYVEPTCRVSRHWMLRSFANGSRQLQAMVEPLSDLCDQAHVFFFPSNPFASLDADRVPLSMEIKSLLARMVVSL